MKDVHSWRVSRAPPTISLHSDICVHFVRGRMVPDVVSHLYYNPGECTSSSISLPLCCLLDFPDLQWTRDSKTCTGEVVLWTFENCFRPRLSLLLFNSRILFCHYPRLVWMYTSITICDNKTSSLVASPRYFSLTWLQLQFLSIGRLQFVSLIWKVSDFVHSVGIELALGVSHIQVKDHSSFSSGMFVIVS